MRLNKGILYAAAAYMLWGIFPIYFKALQHVPADQIVAHRVVWSFLFLIILVAGRRELAAFKAVIRPRIVLIYLMASALLTVNWLTYVWGVNAGFVVETSLGYYINPLVSVLLGVIFLGEKLRPSQWIPVGLAAVAVAYLTVSYGALPWIALVLAFSFGLYGLMKKVAPLGSLQGLTMETGIMLLPAIGYLLFAELNGAGTLGHAGLPTTLLLLLAGLVTAVPLLLFASGARRVPLAMLGLLQYVAPTLQFLLGVLLYGEPFTQARLVGFSLIWLALLIYSAEGFFNHRRKEFETSAGLSPRVGS